MFAKYAGPIFSLVMCLVSLAFAAYAVFFTKCPLILPVCLSALTLITGMMVKSDWPRFWKPLLMKQKSQ